MSLYTCLFSSWSGMTELALCTSREIGLRNRADFMNFLLLPKKQLARYISITSLEFWAREMKHPREAAAPSRYLRGTTNNLKVLHHHEDKVWFLLLSDAWKILFCRCWQVISTLLHCLGWWTAQKCLSGTPALLVLLLIYCKSADCVSVPRFSPFVSWK